MTEKDLRPQFTQLAVSLGAELHWLTVPSQRQLRYLEELTIVVDDRTIHVRVRTGGKGALLGATFTVEASTPLMSAPVTMRRETWIDRLGKNLFINREFQYGDDAFDRAVYIETDVPDASVQRLLNAPAVRGAIIELSPLAERVDFAVPPLDAKAPPDIERTRRSISALLLLKDFGKREAITSFTHTLVRLVKEAEQARVRERGPLPIDPPLPSLVVRIVFALCASFGTWIAMWILAVFFEGPATFGWRAYQHGMNTGVLLWVSAVAISIMLFHGRSTSFRMVIALAIAWLGLIPLSGSVIQRMNGQLDHGPRTTFSGTAYIRYGSKGPPRAHVEVPLLGKDLIVANEIIHGVKISSTPVPVCVVVGAGAFGSKWIVSVEPITTCNTK